LLALKLLLVPAFLAVISFAARRWGPGVAGWLAGFPSLTGPILLFLALERGPEFTARAAVASLAAVLAAVAFGVAYAWACSRLNWFWSWICAVVAWASAGMLLALVPNSVYAALAVAMITLFIAPRAFPRASVQWGSNALPATELMLRMAAGAAMVLLVTAVAEAVGAAWTGLIAVFPVMSSVLAVFSHRANGPGFAAALLRSMVGGFYAFVAYCLSVAVLLEDRGVAVTFIVAVTAAVLVQGAAKAIMMRYALHLK
jgi:uncharacterized membrane protein (GlpM family)